MSTGNPFARFAASPVRKRARTDQPLRQEVRTIKRQVNANKPELRQASYRLDITPNLSTPTALINPTLIDAGTEEIKLHRITVNHLYKQGLAPWGLIFSPRQGYSEADLPNAANANESQNFLQHLDATKQRVFQRRNFSGIITQAASNNEILEMDRRFTIPMKVGMVNPGTQTVNHN